MFAEEFIDLNIHNKVCVGWGLVLYSQVRSITLLKWKFSSPLLRTGSQVTL